MAIEFGPDREEIGQRRVYDPVGFCIYCAATDCKLTDEHPVPSGLQSEHILPEASCAPCQKIITEEFEQYVLRTLLGLPRAAFGIKSRRKKPAPLPSIRVRRPDGRVYRLHFEEGPPPIIFMPVWPTPYTLQGKPAPDSFAGANWAWQPKGTLEQLGADAIISESIEPMKFARFLAKIAHGLAVAKFGTEFFNPWLQEIILGRDERFIHFVGGSLEVRPAESESAILMGFWPYQSSTNGPDLLVAHIRLFPMLGAPDYVVIVGEVLQPWPELEEDL
jgi:hypothetical protein